jgi:hypothetical protein
MRLRLGVGGRAFGVRGGISTRGIGGGIGPLSAGTSWRRRRRGGFVSAFVALLPFLCLAACINNLLGDPLDANKPQTQIGPPLAPTTTPHPDECHQGDPKPSWCPGVTAPPTANPCGSPFGGKWCPTPTLPYSPNGCPADGHPWCSNPTATENPEGDPDTPPTSAPPDWPTTCEQSSAPSWCPNKRTQPGCAGEYCPGNPWEVCNGLQTGRGTPTWCSPYLPQRTGPTPTPTWTSTCAPMDIGCQETVPGVPMVPPGGTLPQGQVI